MNECLYFFVEPIKFQKCKKKKKKKKYKKKKKKKKKNNKKNKQTNSTHPSHTQMDLTEGTGSTRPGTGASRRASPHDNMYRDVALCVEEYVDRVNFA